MIATRDDGRVDPIGGYAPAAAVLAALLVGGGGSPAPLPEMLLQILLAVVFAAWAWTRTGGLGAVVPRQAWVLAGLVAILPVLQLVPLPPVLWQALPGRAIEADALALIGAEQSWRPWSMAPSRTLAALLAILPALAVLIMVSAATVAARIRVIAAALIAGILTVLLGAAQLSGGAGSAVRFYVPDSAFLDGFQANRNSTADVLLLALLALAALVRLRREHRGNVDRPTALIAGGAAVLLVLGLVLAGSRTGIALLAPTLMGCAILLGLRLSVRTVGLATAGLAIIALVAWLTLADNGAIARIAARFSFERELRPDIWRDSLYAAQQTFPFGSGVGNFASAVMAGERLEAVDELVTNRAHNDYLELAVEGGIVGLGLLAAATALLVRAAWTALRDFAQEASILVRFGCLGLMVPAVHSLVDYPFRSMSLACLGAACAGLVLQPPRGRIKPAPSGEPEE